MEDTETIIVRVWLDSKYKKNSEFELPINSTKEEIIEEINIKFHKWFNFDVWEKEQLIPIENG